MRFSYFNCFIFLLCSQCTIKCGLDEFNLVSHFTNLYKIVWLCLSSTRHPVLSFQLSEAGVLNAEKSFEIVDSNTKMEELARVKMRETIAECSKKYSTPGKNRDHLIRTKVGRFKMLFFGRGPLRERKNNWPTS